MRLSDIVSHSGLSFYAEVALVIFFAVFAVIVWRILTPSRAADLEAARRLPLDDDQTRPGARP